MRVSTHGASASAVFSAHRDIHRVKEFRINQPLDPVALGESFEDLRPMLPNALLDVAGHADVEGAIALAGQDADTGLLHRAEPRLDPRFREGDGNGA